MILTYLFLLFEGDKKTLAAIENLYVGHNYVIFDKLTDKSIISTMSRNMFAVDEDFLFEHYFRDGILCNDELMKFINFDYFMRYKEGTKYTYDNPGDRFKKLINKQYLQS